MPKKRSKKVTRKRNSRRLRAASLKPYKSGLEKEIAEDLESRGKNFEYERETLVFVQPAQTRKYTPDFFLDNGVVIEVKGRWKPEDRKKIGLVIEQNPDLDLRMLFARDNTISANSRTRYSTFCKKRGIKFAIGRKVPEEWLNE